MEAVFHERLVGQQVGPCQLERLLSYGHVHATYRARQLPSNRPVTLTLLSFPEEMPTLVRQQFRTQFLQEAPVLVEMSHKHLVPLYGGGEWEGCPYLIMPFLPAELLATILGQRKSCTPARALTVLEQVSAGLEYAHGQGIIHGALTPSHLLVSQNQQIGIAGVGLLHLLQRYGMLPLAVSCDRMLTVAGPWFVNPRYLAPECMQGQVADIRSDIYSLALILYDLLVGTLPSVEAPSQAIVREQGQFSLPRALADVLQQAFAVDPRVRFQRVSDLLAAFAEGVVEAEQVLANNQPASSPLPAMRAILPESSTLLTSRSPSQERSLSSANLEVSLSEIRSVPLGPKRPFLRRRYGMRKSRVHESKTRHMSRRHMLGKLARGVTLGGLCASGVSITYLMTTALSNLPPSPASNKGLLPPALNTAQIFTNPRNGRKGILVRLPNGALVAYDLACTHVGVYVYYDSKTHMLVCPAHQALFDPANGARVVSGPAPSPLPKVSIHTNSDGTLLLGEG